MSNVFESGGSPEDGNNFSHWSPNITRLDFRLCSLWRLLLNTCCNVAGGWTESKTFLRTCVPPSISNRASLVPFVFSSETAYTRGIHRWCRCTRRRSCSGSCHVRCLLRLHETMCCQSTFSDKWSFKSDIRAKDRMKPYMTYIAAAYTTESVLNCIRCKIRCVRPSIRC